MNSPLHQFTLTQIIIGAFGIVVLLAAIQYWALRLLNAEPGDEMDSASGDKSSEILGDAPVRSKVGTPRPRRLQPLRAGEEEPVLASARSGAATEIPADSLAVAGAAALAKSAESKSAVPDAKPTILPPLVTALGDAASSGTKKPEPAAASTDKPRESVALPPLAVGAPATPKAEPVSLASTASAPQAATSETDDVKKRKILPSVSSAEQKGGAPVVSPKAAEVVAAVPPPPPAAPAKPIEPPAAPKPEPAPVKTGDRPRIFLPANLPATAAKPGGEAAPVPAVPAAPAPVEAKVPVPELPSKPADKEAKPAAAPEPKSEAKPVPSAVPVPPIPSEPVAAKTETPVPPSREAAEAKEEKAPAPVPAAPEPLVPAVAAGEATKTPAVEVPSQPIPPPVPILPSIAAPKEKSVSIPQPTMAQNESTTDLPANSRASAQLTLGFEVTSLQLTPFFKLGAVQLKAISNVASLHLVATQSADNPLAAGISFQIDTVELNESSHIRSILLKPFQGEEPAAVIPHGKFNVDAIQLAQGGEGAPISVTSSGQSPAAVQLLATFTIASMEFTPAFEIGALRLEPTSNSVLLRLEASSRPAALDLPPSFEVANVQLGDGAHLAGMRLTPGGKAA